MTDLNTNENENVKESKFKAGDYKTYSLTNAVELLFEGNWDTAKINWLEPSYEKDSKERNLRLEFCNQVSGEEKTEARIICLFHMDKYCSLWHQLDGISRFTMVYGLKQKLASDISSLSRKTKFKNLEEERLEKILDVYEMLSKERTLSRKRKAGKGKVSIDEIERNKLQQVWDDATPEIRNALKNMPDFIQFVEDEVKNM